MNRKPAIYERIMLDGIRRSGGFILKTRRQDEKPEFTMADGTKLRSDIITDMIAVGFLVPRDPGLFDSDNDPLTYSLAERLP